MAGNYFDEIAAVAFDTTTSIMGYQAEWHQTGGSVITATVHYKEASSVGKIGNKEYDAAAPVIEYKRGDFVGLRELVDDNEPEVIKVNFNGSWLEFVTVKDKKLFDGSTIQVKLQRK